MRLNWKNIAPLFLFLCLSVCAYFGVHKTFYQQDEWQTLGHNISEGWVGIIAHNSIFQIVFAEGRPFARAFYKIFLPGPRQSIIPLFAFGLLLHAVNAWLIFLLVRKINGNALARWAAGLFFVLNSAADQAVIWASAVCTIPATTLLLVSIYWYVDFLQTNNKHKRNLAFLFVILSLYMKETGLFVFILYPVIFAYWHKTIDIKYIARTHWALLLYGGVMASFRILRIVFAPALPGFVNGKTGGFLFPVLYHSVVYPLTSFSQLFVPAADLYAFVPGIVRSEYTYFVGSPLFDLAGQGPVADAVSLIGTICMVCVVGYMVFAEKQNIRARRLVIVGILLAMLSFLPYAVLHRDFSVLSSRYYYAGVVGAAIIFGYIVAWIYKRIPKAVGILFVIIVGLYLFHHVQAIQKDLDLQIQYANERKTFLSEMKRVHPIMDDRTVFYIYSNRKYLGDITYPFQNGLGYILEVWYFQTGKIPKSFLSSNFLWDLGEEGYRSTGTSGFGYFEHLDKLGEEVALGKVSPNIVYGYFYDSTTKTISDITGTIREQLATLSGELR